MSYENVTISTGGNISVLQGIFPNSYMGWRGSNVFEYDVNPTVSMTLKAITTGTGPPIDEYINVFFNPNTYVITDIRHGSW